VGDARVRRCARASLACSGVGALEAYLAKVKDCAYKITDADVQAVKDAGISEDEIFEQTVAVAVAEGRRRIAAAEKVIG